MKSDDKIRPIQERLAAIEGSTTFKDLREGFGGFANLTTLDLMGGLAIVREQVKISIGKGEAKDDLLLAPEILETYFASTQMYRGTLVRSYLANTRVEEKHIVPHRMGATLAAQMMAGVTFSRAQDAEYAFICNCRLVTLRDLRSHAAGWFHELLDAAIPRFAAALRDVIQERVVTHGYRLIEGSIVHDAMKKAASVASGTEIS